MEVECLDEPSCIISSPKTVDNPSLFESLLTAFRDIKQDFSTR
jgi:hypothetical protein